VVDLVLLANEKSVSLEDVLGAVEGSSLDKAPVPNVAEAILVNHSPDNTFFKSPYGTTVFVDDAAEKVKQQAEEKAKAEALKVAATKGEAIVNAGGVDEVIQRLFEKRMADEAV
jgi:hypothetical protein